MVTDLTVSQLMGLIFGGCLVAGLVSAFLWDALGSITTAIGQAISKQRKEDDLF